MSKGDRKRGDPWLRPGSSVYQISVGGVRRTSGTKDFEEAKKLQQYLNAELWRKKFLKIEDAPAVHSWKEMCVKWSKERGSKASFDFDLAAIDWWTTYLGDVQDIRTITRDMIDEIVQAHRNVTPNARTSANNTANHYIGIVSAMLNAACNEWNWIERAPKLRRYPKPEGRERVLTADEWRMLEKQLPLHMRWAATFALATGLRKGKVFRLEWQQINLKERRLTFTGTSNKLGNTIPLNETAMAVLQEIRSAPVSHHQRVFFWHKPVRGKGLVIAPLAREGDAWRKAMQRAGFGEFRGKKWVGDGMTFHGLRHTFATWLGERGVPSGIIDRLGGWSGKKDTREKYTHLNVEHLRQFSAVIDHVLAGRDVRFLVAVEASEARAGMCSSDTGPLALTAQH